MREPVGTTLDMNTIVGTHDIVFITLDALRYDVAQTLFDNQELPVLSRYLPADGWERRHSPGSFTYASHHAFFAGFLPTPAVPGVHPRLFATEMRGAMSITTNTCEFSEASVPRGLASRGYRTICIGGVGFFNKATPLGAVLPAMFDESYWEPSFGVGNPRSTERQVGFACRKMAESADRVFLFINVSAIHHPNRCYVPGSKADSLETHAAALRYVDGALRPLLEACAVRAPTLCIVCSDHGAAYGEDGFTGHRIAHSAVWDVPYAHFVLGQAR
jgi:hypothetical protein